MKKLFTFVLAAMAFVACTQNEVEELTANRADVPETLTVGFEGGDTRVELNEALKTVWSKGDEVSVFYLSDANQKWQYQGETGERLGTLKCVDRGVAEEKMQRVVVAYPYNAQYVVNTDTYNLYASLPAVQSYKDGSYGAEGNIMVAQSEFTQFSLKSVCGWLRVELTGEGESVKSITLRGNAGEQVAGLIYVDTATAEATLASEMGEASDEEQVGGVGGGLEFDDTVFTEVTLNCGSGVELGAEAKSFYIALLPQTFEEGMTIEINYANGNSQTLVCENNVTIRRNHISPIESEANVEVEVPTNQLWYTATVLVEPYDASAFNVAIVSNEWDEATGEGIITFDGKLTMIGDHAFYGCYKLRSVTIPDSVTTIGEMAFWNCNSLTSVTIPNNVTTIGNGAFAACISLAEFKGKFAADEGRCLIIDGVLNAFAIGCGAAEYTIPDSVTTIGYAAFFDCSNLTSVTIPDNVTTIGEEAFAWCRSLTSVTIPDSVTTIGDAAFNHCESLTSVTIGDSVTTIGDLAFSYCYDLTSVTIPDSVTTIGDGVFADCSNLAEFKGKFAADGGRCLIIDGMLNAFALSCGVTEYTIPDSVTTIGEGAFGSCESLTSITIPDSVTTIGGYAFSYCDSLTSVIIPDSVTTIGDYAFYYCTSLTSVYCEAITPPSLGYNAFNYFYYDNYDNYYYEYFIGCPIYVPAESVETYKAAAYWSEYADYIVGYNFETGEGDVVKSELFYTATALVEPYDASAFNAAIVSNEWDETTGEGVITFDGELTTIGEYAFYYCSSLTSVTIPDSVTTIGVVAFGGCSSLTSVYITDVAAWCNISFGDSFSNPLWYAKALYLNNELVTELTIPDSITTIGNYAFYNCDSLTSVTIPDSVTTIGKSAFNTCSSLTSVTIPDSVTTIGEYAFSKCHSLTSVTIGDSVTTIGYAAFYDCDSLTSVTIPDSVTTIGNGAFASCLSLAEFKGKFAADGGRCLVKDNTIIAYAEASGTTYTIPDSVTMIGDAAFQCCDSLTSVTIPDSVTSIGGGAFYNCTSLTSVTIGDSVTAIGDGAFYYCTSLTSVYCEATTPPTLSYNVFDANADGRKIYVPAESVEAYKAAKYWSDYAADIVGYDFE